MKKSMIIIGAGNGLSRAVACRFGKAGYQIGLISRSNTNLQNLKSILNAADVEVRYETADVSKLDELHIAINTLDHYLEGADVVLYNAAHLKQKDILKEKLICTVRLCVVSLTNTLLLNLTSIRLLLQFILVKKESCHLKSI